MDVWTELLHCLANPLCVDNDLARALARAADARSVCPKASASNIKGRLAQVVGLTSDLSIQDFASQLQRRIRGSSQPAAQGTAPPIAQDADRDDEAVDWWRGFVPLAVAKGPPRSGESERGCPKTSVQPKSLATSSAEIPTNGGADQPSCLEEFLPWPLPKRTKCEDNSSNLETFGPPRNSCSRRAAASKTWSEGRNCGSVVRRGPGGGIGSQAQVILSNAYRNCETLPRPTRDALRCHIKPIGRLHGTTFAGKMTSWLSGLSASTE